MQYSGPTNLLPKKFDKFINAILYDLLEIFDPYHIAAAVILFSFFVIIGWTNFTAVETNSSSFLLKKKH